MSRANERLAWRGGQLAVVPGVAPLESMFAAFGLHEAPAIHPTRAAALAAGPAGGGEGLV